MKIGYIYKFLNFTNNSFNKITEKQFYPLV